jgi:hypothetical protein
VLPEPSRAMATLAVLLAILALRSSKARTERRRVGRMSGISPESARVIEAVVRSWRAGVSKRAPALCPNPTQEASSTVWLVKPGAAIQPATVIVIFDLGDPFLPRSFVPDHRIEHNE